MSDAKIGLCEIEFYLAGVRSLKEKRGILKSMLAKMRNEFNVAVSNSTSHLQQSLQNVVNWIESHYPDAMIVKHKIEII
jgi:uncharacterized protein YlxP (DUF503 family)